MEDDRRQHEPEMGLNHDRLEKMLQGRAPEKYSATSVYVHEGFVRIQIHNDEETFDKFNGAIGVAEDVVWKTRKIGSVEVTVFKP